MFKAFFRLWLVVFIPLFILIFPNAYSPIAQFNEYAQKTRFIKTYSGTFYLIEQALAKHPQKDKNTTLQTLAQHFGYHLSLISLTHDSINDSQRQQLNQGEFVFINAEPELLLKKHTTTDDVITLALDITPQEDIQRASQGTLYLLTQTFQQTPLTQWDALIDTLAPHFQFELTYQPLAELTLSASDTQQLIQNNLLWRQTDDQQLIFYSLLAKETMVLIATPIPVSASSPLIIIMLLVMFIAVISIGMYMWVHPLWRDLLDLVNTATTFGKGELTLRATLSKTSVVAKLGEAFNTMAQQIEALIKNQRQLTNAIAHDLRTPLYRLRFAFEMLDEQNLSPEEHARYRHSMNKSINDLDHLINQTLLLSRYSRTAELINFSDCQLANSIKQEVQLFQDEHNQLTITLAIQAELETHHFFVDSNAMIRAFNNLVSNACRYAHTDILISLTLNPDTQHYHLSVEDDGPGIPESHWQAIFEPFAQLNNEQRNLTVGHGLGLAIVRQISQWHQGGCRLSHSKLHGAKCEIFWPVNNNR